MAVLEIFSFNGKEYELPAPKGLTFQSKPVNLQVIVRGEQKKWEYGIEVGKDKELTAEFGDNYAPMLQDADTEEYYVATRGGYMNTLEQGTQKGWDDFERMLVEKKLLVTQDPQTHWLHEPEPMAKPWPKYDVTPADKIAEMAEAMGMVHEAIAYENDNKKRKSVLAKLDEAAVRVDEELSIEVS